MNPRNKARFAYLKNEMIINNLCAITRCLKLPTQKPSQKKVRSLELLIIRLSFRELTHLRLTSPHVLVNPLQTYFLPMLDDHFRSLIKKYRFLFKDLHGNDFFLDKKSVEDIKNLFGHKYSDEELVEMISGNFTLYKSGFVEEFVAEIQGFLRSVERRRQHSPNFHNDILPVPGIKDKKKYEINIMAGVVDEMARDLGVDTLIDFGGGLGHLAKRLSHRGYKVIIIDGNRDLCIKAQKYVDCICDYVNREGMVSLEQELRERLSGRDCIFYSLHACGSLSDSMIELFCRLDNARGLINVGCCYNLINYSISGESDWSENEKMAACQCPARWTLEDAQNIFWMNFHRSMVQRITKDKITTPGYRIPKLGIKNPADITEYASLLKNMLNIDLDLNDYRDYFLHNRSTFCTWWAMRALYGQLVEYAIIKERSCYVNDTGKAESRVEILFDPIKSPRKYGILARKYPLSVKTGKQLTDEKADLSAEEGKEEEAKAWPIFGGIQRGHTADPSSPR